MFVNWDSQINKSFTSHSLIGFEDFYTTFEDILKVSKIKSSGISFLNLLNGKDFNERKVLNSYYDSRWGLGLINLGLFILKQQNISSTKTENFSILKTKWKLLILIF